MNSKTRIPASAIGIAGLCLLTASEAATAEKAAAVRVWNDRDLAEWAVPVAGLNVPPGHFSEREYYAAPVAGWLRTYPVYFPGREPRGYQESLEAKRPKPLIPGGVRTTGWWVEAGKRVFREIDVPAARTYDPEIIAAVRSMEAMQKAGVKPEADGTIAGLRWVPTPRGLALSVHECGGCHTRVLPDGSRIDGAPFQGSGNAVLGRLVTRAIETLFGDDPAVWRWRSSAVPWIPNDPHETIRTMQPADLRALFRRVVPGAFARFNGSPFYPAKTPDLIGIRDRRYIDHTATHRLRNQGDLMRYAALVSCCDSADFGPHRMFSDSQRRIHYRFPDEVLMALAAYIDSLEPPPNPNLGDPRIAAGRRVFEREGCRGCHTPPFYTNNKLTLAEGFRPPKDHPLAADIMDLTVGTDPGLALRTRKGTGLYKVPSLRGVWYRGRFHHDGSIASLEEWFDPARLRHDYVPELLRNSGITSRPVKGHEFGLNLDAAEKAALIAFLKSL